MKKRYIFTLIVLTAFLLAPFTVKADEYVPGEILVKFKEGTSQQAISAANSKVGATHLKSIRFSGVSKLSLPDDVSVMEAVLEYMENPDVEYAQPNYIYRVAVTPTETDFTKFWGLHNTGQTIENPTDTFTTGNLDADIDAPDAWDIQQGSSTDVVIAVIDTGVKYTHTELDANIWSNSDETASDNIDNDGNGYIDDTIGWDFVNNDNDPADDYGHGTHVAGTIAAEANNGEGGAGVMWVASIMPLKSLGADGSGTSADIAEAIFYAVQNAIDNSVNTIISMSLVGSSDEDNLMKDAVFNAQEYGVLVVAAAGNSSSDNDTSPMYPASYDFDNIISVAATTQTDELASFSNYGATSVDLAAPGVNIYSTVPTTAECTSSDMCDDSGYNYAQGTSMATPHVAGVAGLVWSQSPTYSYLEVKSAILDNVSPLICLSGLMVTSGRLNAYQALTGSTSGPAKPGAFTATALSTSQIFLSWTDVTGNTAYRIFRRVSTSGCSSYIQIASVGADDTSFTDVGLSEGASYTYIIRPYDNTDNGAYSDEASATTLVSEAVTTGSPDSGSPAGKGGCFIATATYGSPMHPYVKALREFRDKHLLNNSLGKRFVKLYYKYSPIMADAIRDNEILKTIARIILTPIVMLAIFPYTLFGISIVVFISVVIILRRITRRQRFNMPL